MEKIWISGAYGHIGSALVKLLDYTKYETQATLWKSFSMHAGGIIRIIFSTSTEESASSIPATGACSALFLFISEWTYSCLALWQVYFVWHIV